MSNLWRINKIAELLDTSPGAARSWLKRKGVSVIDLGPGRNLGKRWIGEEVLRAIEESRITPTVKSRSPSSPQLRIRQSGRPLYGKDRKEQVALIKGKSVLQ